MKVGTKIKIISTTNGCRGAEGFIGVVTDECSNSGMLKSDPGYNVKLATGTVWRINPDAKVEILEEPKPHTIIIECYDDRVEARYGDLKYRDYSASKINDISDCYYSVNAAVQKLFEAIENERKTFHVGDQVKIIDSGRMYSINYGWVKEHISDPKLLAKWKYDSNPWFNEGRRIVDDKVFEIKHIAENHIFIQDLAFPNGCYLIGADGLRKV